MSQDKMQDVFPVPFDFVKGEQGTAQKFTGLVKHTDSAFSRMSLGIGDPWDYTSHTGSGGAYRLSLKNLSQASIARCVGPSDWMSPAGGCWNQQNVSSINVVLAADRNSWTLGYPLVKVDSTLTETSKSSSISALTWSDVSVSGDTDSVLNSEKASPELVVADGDFYVDYYKGVITAYEVTSVAITLTISNLNMFGPGVPWGTQNVIPNWEESTLCTVAKVGDVGSVTTYTLTFPSVANQTRTSDVNAYGQRSLASSDADDSTWAYLPGYTSLYRLPPAITGAGLSTGDTIPEGFCLLWDGPESTGRVVPQITFKYKDANSLTLETPLDWLTVGSSSYRVIVSGSSVAENINYLMQMTRNNEHVGLTDNPTLGYTVPLSHDNLEDRYTGDIDNSLADVERYMFTESNYPVNPHSQYLHRGGYMDNDVNDTYGTGTGNTGNAMRGDFVLTGDYLGDGSGGFVLRPGSDFAEYAHHSFAVSFGGGNTDGFSEDQNACIKLSGLWGDGDFITGGRAYRSGFGLRHTGAATTRYGSNYANDKKACGSLSIYSGTSGPLFLRGYYDEAAPGTYEKWDGAVLGFDLGQRNEPNYIRMLLGCRTVSATYDVFNLPAKMSQTDHTDVLDITPDLDGNAPGTTLRFAPEQMREFRFRGVPWVDGATNTIDSVGGATLRAANNVEDLEEYFTSPGIVGSDFFNVYSNAIFFSDTGDGKATSFTTEGEGWLNDSGGLGTFGTHTPTGIFYSPDKTGATDSRFIFNTKTGATYSRPLILGWQNAWLSTRDSINITVAQGDLHLKTTTSGNIKLDTSTSTGNLVMSGLPTVDPTGGGAGIVWNSGGTLKITAS